MKKTKRYIAALLVLGLLFDKSFIPVRAEENADGYEEYEEAETYGEQGEYEQREILVLYEDGVQISETAREIFGEEQEVAVLSEMEDETIALVQLPDGISAEEAIQEYEEKEGVLEATPNYLLELSETESTNDPDLSSQSYLEDICAEEAWEYYSQLVHEKTRVAVLDTGADIHHPELKNIINLDISGEVVDKTGTIGPLQGDDYINGKYTTEGTGHGTHICGILAAEANNLEGIAGVGSCEDNSAIELMVVDIFSGVKTTNMAYLIYGMEYAAERGAKVINLSLGVDVSRINDSILKAECDRLEEQNITLVCAAGNEGISDDGQIQEVPCDYDSTIGVIAVDAENKRASFSNYGTKKDIASPGVSIYSTLKDSAYGRKSGTSMSTPMVTAAAGMLYAVRPGITSAEVKEILTETAGSIGAEDMPGIGILNCEEALKASGGKLWIPFTDVPINSWYYDYVASIYKQGIMTGLDETTFGPGENLARAQFAMILYRIAGEPEVEYDGNFPDVTEEEWYAKAVAWAGQTGVITGYSSNGYFGPNDSINREQLATMLYRYAKFQNIEIGDPDENVMDVFSDAESVNTFALKAMSWAVSAGIIQGDNGKLNPQGSANRAECATMIERFNELRGF